MESTSLKIIKAIKDEGYEAYWAGGCVRDLLMGKTPHDYDIVTSALPDEIERIIQDSHLLKGKTIPLGKKFGIVMAIVHGHHFEIATFRSDSALSDGRRPDAVFFTNAREDAQRRDFTVNGMFYDPLGKEVLDYVGGQEDLKNRVLRFIGDPDLRIREDYLRLIRAVRFKFSLQLEYDPATRRALEQSAHFIKKTSTERIREEISRMWKASKRLKLTFDLVIQELEHTGLLVEVLPEIDVMKITEQPPEYHAEGNVYIHTLRCLHALHSSTAEPVIWAVLLHDVGKHQAMKRTGKDISFHGHEEIGARLSEAILHRLHFRKVDRERIVWLVEHHMMLNNFERMRDSKRRRWFMHPWFPDLLQVMYADSVGTSPVNMDDYNRLEKMYEQEKNEKLLAPVNPLLTGEDIMAIFQLASGKMIGELLEALHDAQLEGKVRDREEAIDLLNSLIAPSGPHS